MVLNQHLTDYELPANFFTREIDSHQFLALKPLGLIGDSDSDRQAGENLGISVFMIQDISKTKQIRLPDGNLIKLDQPPLVHLEKE